MPHRLSFFHSRIVTSEHGQTMTETAVLMALVVIVVMAAVLLFGGGLGNLWSQLASTLPSG
jgi:Flp pilus assembly pilin Flp